MTTSDLTIFYDGSCPLCRAEIAHYKTCQGADALTWVDVSSASADLGEGLSCGQAMARFHVRLSDGQLLSGAAAFVAVWARLPKWRWLARFAALPFALVIMEWVYRATLVVRPFLSRWLTRLQAK